MVRLGESCLPARPIEVKDLEEGDIAVIPCGMGTDMVFVYSNGINGNRNMVSLTKRRAHWTDISDNCIRVIRVLKPGDTLEVCR